MYEMRQQQFVVKRQGPLSIHLVPYSEHSSFTELQQYVKFLKPKQLVPTVGVGGDASGKKRAAILKHFRGLVDETASKARYSSLCVWWLVVVHNALGVHAWTCV